jgi:predicted MFS family arabinose efflux permease
MLAAIARAYRAAFAGLPRRVWLLAIASLVNRSGTMVLPFLGLYLTRQLEFSMVDAGRILSLWGLGGALGAALGGWLSDRVGPLRVQICSLLGTGVGFIVLGQMELRLTVAISVLLVSVVGDAFRPAIFATVVEESSPAVRTRALALIRLAANLGMAIGPAVGGVLAVHHYGLLFVADAATCWLAAILLWVFLGRHQVRRTASSTHPARGRAATPWRDLPYLGFLGIIVGLGLVFFQFFSTLPLYLREVYGLHENIIGPLLATNAVIIALFEMVLLRAIEHLDHLLLVAVGCLLVGVGLGLMPFGRGVGYAAFTVVIWTIGEMLSLPMTNSIAAARGAPGSSGRFLGAYSLAFSLAFIVAPVAGTLVYERLGHDALWFGTATLGAALGAGCLVLRRPFARSWERHAAQS